MKPIILLNAPPQSGKDTLANILKSRYPVMKDSSFKNPMFYLFCHTVGMDYHTFMDLYNTQGWKDTPQEFLGGKTPRALMIHISEGFIKPFFGDEYYGQQVFEQIHFFENSREDEFSWVIPDSGFDSESAVLIKHYPERVVCIQFTRDGKTFAGDSRGYVTNVPNTVKLEHPGDPELMADLVEKTLKGLGYEL